MNMLALIAITWIGKEYRFLGLDWSYLMVLGFIGNALFSMRFLVQWVASERQGDDLLAEESHQPLNGATELQIAGAPAHDVLARIEVAAGEAQLGEAAVLNEL